MKQNEKKETEVTGRKIRKYLASEMEKIIQDGWKIFLYRISREERLRLVTEIKAWAIQAPERKKAEKLLEVWRIFWDRKEREDTLILAGRRRS